MSDRTESKKTQLIFLIPERNDKKLQELMKAAGLKTRAELCNNALTFLEWCIQEVKAGRIIVSVDEKKGKFKELVTPVLDPARLSRARR